MNDASLELRIVGALGAARAELHMPNLSPSGYREAAQQLR